MLDDLPNSETFKSHSVNALKQGTAAISGNRFSLTLPALSITAVKLSGQGSITAVNHLPESHSLALRAFPNPFNPRTTIEITLPQSGQVTVDVFDLLGRRVETLFSGFKQTGTHQFALDAAALSSGMYWVRYSAAGELRLQKILLIR